MRLNLIELIYVDKLAFMGELVEQTRTCGLLWTQTTPTIFTSSSFTHERSSWRYVISRSGNKYYLNSIKDNRPHLEFNSSEFEEIIKLLTTGRKPRRRERLMIVITSIHINLLKGF